MSGQLPIKKEKNPNRLSHINDIDNHQSFSSNDSNLRNYSYLKGNFLQHNPSTSSSNKSDNVENLELKYLEKGRRKKKKCLKHRKPSLDNQLTFLSDIVQQNPNENAINNNRLYNAELPQSNSKRKSSHNVYKHVDSFGDFENDPKAISVVQDLQAEIMNLKKQSNQMKATIKWWSEKSNSWKSKWSVVKHECKQLNKEMERTSNSETELFNQLEVFKQQRQLLIQENKRLRSMVSGKKSYHHESDTSSACSNELSVNRESTVLKTSNKELDKVVESELLQKNSSLQLKIDESLKTIQAERDAKVVLNKTIESLEKELSELKNKFQEVKITKQETLKQMATAQESHRCEIVRMNENFQEESKNRSQLERKLQELREEIEQLQRENAVEWGRRERTESEKVQLEREVKKLRWHAEEMRKEVEARRKTNNEDKNNETRQLKAQLQEYNQELHDLRRQSARDEKLMSSSKEELNHERRRSDLHEKEARELRGRVEEVRKLQQKTEDENDSLQNQNRKLQRLIEEKEEENEQLQVENSQLQARVRNESRIKSSYLRSNCTSTSSESESLN